MVCNILLSTNSLELRRKRNKQRVQCELNRNTQQVAETKSSEIRSRRENLEFKKDSDLQVKKPCQRTRNGKSNINNTQDRVYFITIYLRKSYVALVLHFVRPNRELYK